MKNYLILLLIMLTSVLINAQNLPLLYENDFEDNTTINDFEFTDLSAWRINNQSLELFGKSNYQPDVRSPQNIAVLKNYMVGDFILEVDLKQTGREYGHRDLCLFFNFKDASNFYYIHIASVADPNAHNIFLVNDEPRKNIAEKTTNGVNWGNTWHKVKIVRSIEKGHIQVYFDDMDVPIMESYDRHHLSGYIGFGSFDDTGIIDNIKLYGQRIIPKMNFFR